MNTRYIMTRFDFDHPTRGWKKPCVFNTFNEAETVARRMWELEQNKYVLETWDGNEDYDGEYGERNWFETDGEGRIKACSEYYDNPFPQYIVVEPVDRDVVVFRAREDDDNDMDVKVMFMGSKDGAVYSEILRLMSNEVYDSNLTSPVVKLNESEAYLYEENFTNESHYQIVDVRKYHDPIDVSKYQ